MRIPPTLLALLAFMTALLLQPGVQAAIVDPDLRSWMEDARFDEPKPVVLQLRQGLTSRDLAEIVGTARRGEFKRLGMVSTTLTAAQARRIASDSRVFVVSTDAEVVALAVPAASASSLLQRVSGSDAAAAGFAVNGNAITIAVLDSGKSDHPDLADGPKVSMLPATRNTTDNYGHGTYVASIALGRGTDSLRRGLNFSGIAVGAKLANVRVLDDYGKGKVSSVLAGIDWVLANASKYNIRVVNMSLGMPAIETYRTDPLCQATKRLHEAGIVTVVAAGNYGKSPTGTVAYGSITSPANSPWVITVGAVNDQGTPQRSDDSVATYSSRGPTRSFDSATGLYDDLIKPDMVATGNHVVGAKAPGNWIMANYPSSGLEVSSSYMYLNGTSVAAPVVAGVVAMMLQANPALRPSQVKAVLMYTSQTLPAFSVFEQGAGEVNAEGAVKMAVALKRAPLGTNIAGTVLLAPAKMPAPSSTLSGEAVPWSRGYVLIQRQDGTGLQRAGGVFFSEGILFAEGMLFAGGIRFAECEVSGSGVIFAERSVLTSRGVTSPGRLPRMTGGGALDASSVLFSEGAVLGNGSLVDASGVLIAESVLFAEGVIFAERSGSGGGGRSGGARAMGESLLFSQGILLDESDLVALLYEANTVLVAGEAFMYY